MNNPKPKTPFLIQLARFFGACLFIFGLLVLGVGLPKHAAGFLLPGSALLALGIKPIRVRVAALVMGFIRRPSRPGPAKRGRI